jgi:hypothetical protein
MKAERGSPVHKRIQFRLEETKFFDVHYRKKEKREKLGSNRGYGILLFDSYCNTVGK